MKFTIVFSNELPFMLELPNGGYNVFTSMGEIELKINADMFRLYTAKFPKFAGKAMEIIGTDEALQATVTENNISNYAFGECKTFVQATIEEERDFTETEYASVSEEECISELKTQIIRNKIPYTDTEELTSIATNNLQQLTIDEKNALKQNILIGKQFSSMNRIYAYYEALNRLIKEYAYISKHYWVNEVNENILEGTVTQKFINGKHRDTVTFAGLVPSILPCRRKFPDLLPDQLDRLRTNLTNVNKIPIEDELLVTANNLWYRMEYRAAVIESSAALEIAVENKLVEKMKQRGMGSSKIRSELRKSEMDFYLRCNTYLKKYTRTSFVYDNSELWKTISKHRKAFRHKIVHSDLFPNSKQVQEIIKDFSKAIEYIRGL